MAKLKKIILIEPPFYRLFKNTYSLTRYPLSLGFLASYIDKKTDWKVKVYNADFHPSGEQIKESYLAGQGFENYKANLKNLDSNIWKDIYNIINQYQPDVVGITVLSPKLKSALNIAKKVKEINSNIMIVAGGAHVTSSGKSFLNNHDFDFGVKGEGERTIVDFLKSIENNNQFEKIDGLIYRKNNENFENRDRQYMKNLDEAGFPYHKANEILVDYERYPMTAFRYLFSSRGCPFDCFFCASKTTWKRKFRLLSVDSIVKEIKALQNLGLQSIHFDDDTFGINKKHLIELCKKIIEQCPGITWSCEMHVNLINEPVVKAMKKAGCYAIALGIESGNNELLKMIRKKSTIEKAEIACRIVSKYNIELRTFFILGCPWETNQTLKDTIKAMNRINSDRNIMGIFAPYPGADSYEFCLKNNLLSDDFDPSYVNHQSLNYNFCFDFPQPEFKRKALAVLKKADRKNTLNRIKQLFSKNTLWRVKEIGIFNSLKKSLKIISGK